MRDGAVEPFHGDSRPPSTSVSTAALGFGLERTDRGARSDGTFRLNVPNLVGSNLIAVSRLAG